LAQRAVSHSVVFPFSISKFIFQEIAMVSVCKSCGIEAPTQQVLFVQHIGAIVMFFHKRIGGEFCRNCVNKYFREYGLMTLFFGWWGIISVLATPVVLAIDLFNYFRAWNLPPVPPGATVPRLDDRAINQLQPHWPQIVARLNSGEKFDDVAGDLALKASVTPAQVALYTNAMIKHQSAQQ
jgi:hypothetical protein